MFIFQSDFTSHLSREVGLSVLAGEPAETLFREARLAGTSGAFQLQQAGRWFIGGASVVPAGGDLDGATRQLYHMLFAAQTGLNLCRVWHYVPRINEPGNDGLENYRAFCHGRSLAFERQFGADFQHRLPAASAVGTEDERLTIVFAACADTPRHFENPRQVPAYQYPKEHGPRSPSFSRATLVAAEGYTDAFISGTAAIEGHETVAPGDTEAQIERTVDNLRTISQACGLGELLGADRGGERHFKVYLRHRTDLAAVRAALEQRLFVATDRIVYLRSDICRAALNLEIEATVLGVRAG